MNKEYFNIKDRCRKNLIKHLFKAISIIPPIEKPLLLDVGCGSGVPTLSLFQKFKGNVIALDIDNKSLNRLEEKIKEQNLSDKITLINNSFFEVNLEENQFDIILAEGFLNVVGFQNGFLKLIQVLKRNRYLIIHDDFLNQNNKIKIIENNNCKVLNSFRLDEQIWWDDYYMSLEKEISSIENMEFLALFESDLKEIEYYKQNSSKFNSVYYVIEKL